MTSESQDTTKKSKKDKKVKRKIVDDEKEVEKKKVKKDKKKKKEKIESAKEEAQQDDGQERSEENVDEEPTEIKKKGPSKRQLKKEKAELRAAEAKECSKQEASQKALNYVSMWKHAKDQWKFNKVKQIWLMDNLLDEKYVPDDHVASILEYFEGCKGLARQKLIDKAMKVIKKVEDSIEEDEELVETTEYKRARQLLQALPNET